MADSKKFFIVSPDSRYSRDVRNIFENTYIVSGRKLRKRVSNRTLSILISPNGPEDSRTFLTANESSKNERKFLICSIYIRSMCLDFTNQRCPRINIIYISFSVSQQQNQRNGLLHNSTCTMQCYVTIVTMHICTCIIAVVRTV